MTHTIPPAALGQHIAILGKTGSGKTSTEKLAIEQVVEAGHRVCILDPVKSDHWGLTSSADGKRPGLPFQILGGPHGHVPLHDGAGAAIAELVGTGALPLSILDMSDFGPGGHMRFFVDFVPVLLRKMKGVLYLPIEEAHLFAPKERAGFGAENMSIHYATKLATAGRSKGIRLIVATQSVQQLHNRVLGSCDTMIAMRLTAPADQKPVLDWLKASAPKDAFEKVKSSLASLKTGTGWLCSSEAQIFEQVAFPRIQTFDNSATPDQDDAAHQVVQAKVDQVALRALVGEAVTEAAANDPKALKARIAELERAATSAPGKINMAPQGYSEEYVREREAQGEKNGYERGRSAGYVEGYNSALDLVHEFAGKLVRLKPDDDPPPASTEPAAGGDRGRPVPAQTRVAASPESRPVQGAAGSSSIGGAPRRMLIALAQNPLGLTHRKLGILADVSPGGSTWRGAMAGFRKAGHIEEPGGVVGITPAGLRALGKYEPLPTGQALRDYWQQKIGNSTRGQIFAAILAGRGRAVSAEQVARSTGVELGGSTWRGHMAYLRGLELVSGSTELRAAAELFE